MARAGEQARRARERAIDTWFDRHFHQVLPGSALHAALCIARDDLKRSLGVSRPAEHDNPNKENPK